MTTASKLAVSRVSWGKSLSTVESSLPEKATKNHLTDKETNQAIKLTMPIFQFDQLAAFGKSQATGAVEAVWLVQCNTHNAGHARRLQATCG